MVWPSINQLCHLIQDLLHALRTIQLKSTVGGSTLLQNHLSFHNYILVTLSDKALYDLTTNPSINSCFYYSALTGETQVKFVGNNADSGGRDIFGLTGLSYSDNYRCSVSEDDNIFDFDDSVPSTYRLASNPSRVCFCVNDTQQCQNRAYLVLKETRFPGESFNISVALVGFNFSRVTGSVFATVLDRQAGSVNDNQHIKSIDDYVQSTELTYTVLSNQTSRPLILGLSVEKLILQGNQDDIIKESVNNIYSLACNATHFPAPCAALLHTAIFINITVDNCPLGFQLIMLQVCVNVTKAVSS